LRRGLEGADLGLAEDLHTGGHRVAVDIEARAALMQPLHRSPFDWTSIGAVRESLYAKSLTFVLAATVRGA
jgi:hypothetical protein